MKHFRFAQISVLGLLCAACGTDHPTANAPAPLTPSMVFTMSNAEAGNSVHAYLRSPDGTLVNAATVPTGGTGVGHGLENQGALTLSQDGHHLYVVNSGSNDVSVFRLNGTDLQLTDRVPSGGSLPVSVVEWNGIIYVLNRHVSADPTTGPTIAGFRVSAAGRLTEIVGSDETLNTADTNAAQIGISPDGHWIMVTERALDQIDVIPLSDKQIPGQPRKIASAGHGPFGFAFSDAVRLYIAESAAGTTSAYDIDPSGTLSVLASAISTGQAATCWLTISPDNRWVYVTNTSSRSISSYRVTENGGLTLVASIASNTTGRPIDAFIDTTGEYLSTVTADGAIETFRVDLASGSLTSIQILSGLPPGSNGLTGN